MGHGQRVDVAAYATNGWRFVVEALRLAAMHVRAMARWPRGNRPMRRQASLGQCRWRATAWHRVRFGRKVRKRHATLIAHCENRP
jgi:hypothetical protein